MKVNLSDESGSLTITLFGKNVERFLSCYAKQLMDHNSELLFETTYGSYLWGNMYLSIKKKLILFIQ